MLNLVREGEEDYIEAIRYRRRLKIFENFLLYMGCPLSRERKQKKKSNFHFQKCPRPLTRECPLTGMCKYRVWLGGKTGI